MSNKDGDSVFEVKKAACDVLLKFRLSNEDKNVGKNAVLKREEDYLKGIKIFFPSKKRDSKDRPATIPVDILAGKKHVLGRKNLRDMQDEHGGAGVFEFPLQEHFLLDNQDWKYDEVPEFLDGKNIFDFIDPEIEEKLKKLEEEEEALLAEEGLKMDDDWEDLEPEIKEALNDVKMKEGEIRVLSRQKRNLRAEVKTKPVSELKAKLEERGKSGAKVEARVREESKKRGRTTLQALIEKEKAQIAEEDNEMDVEDGNGRSTRQTSRSRSRLISKSRVRDESRHRTPQKYDELTEHIKHAVEKRDRRKGLQSESDRRIVDLMPKHLNAGKATFKRDRR